MLVTNLVLRGDGDLDFPVLRNDFLDAEAHEPVEGGNLLGNQAVELEVGPDHCPGIFLVNLVLS